MRETGSMNIDSSVNTAVIFLIFLGAVLSLIGVLLNVLQLPGAARLFGIAGDGTIRADARVLAVTLSSQTIARMIVKLLIFITMTMITGRLIGIIEMTIGVYALALLDLAILILDIDSAVTVWARRFIRTQNGAYAT